MEHGTRENGPIQNFDVWRFLINRYVLLLPLLVAASSMVFYLTVRAWYVRDWERHAADLANDMNRELLGQLRSDGDGSFHGSAWWGSLENGQLQRITESYLDRPDVERINIFSVDRRVVHSSEASLIGRVSHHNAALDRALRGEMVSGLELATDHPDFSDAGHAKDLLETYMPIRALDDKSHPTGDAIGAFEIYQDASVMQAALGYLGRWTVGGSVAVLALLALVLLTVGRQVARRVDQERQARERLEGHLQGAVEHLEAEVQKRTAEVRSERESLRTVLDAAPSAFVLLDGDLRVNYASARFRELMGYPVNYEPGMRCGDLWRCAELCAPCVPRIALSTKTPRTVVKSHPLEDGSPRYLEHTAVPILRDDRVESVLEMITDVTGRQEAEEKFSRAARLATAGEVAATVAHEVRNAATTTRLFLQLLAERPVNDADRRSLGAALQSVSRMEVLVQNLLRLARPVASERVAVDVIELLRSTIDLVRPEADRRRVRLVEPALEGNGPLCVADRGLLMEAFLNVLLNAVQVFGPEGNHEQRQVAVSVLSPDPGGDTVVIQVTDSGPGLCDTSTERLFEPFYTTKPDGTGLGLLIVRRIVQSHGGKVVLEEAAEGGATVRMTLPAAPTVSGSVRTS